LRIGFDLDNTIICYDPAFAAAARARNLVPAESALHKKEEIKAYLHAQGDSGRHAWQALQGYMYGRGIQQAMLFDGVLDTLEQLAAEKHELFIISHKTEYGHFDETRTPLRHAATTFLEVHQVTKYIQTNHIFYCATLGEKLATIARLACDLFVDDLADVLFHKDFPQATRRIAFRTHPFDGTYDLVMAWSELQALV